MRWILISILMASILVPTLSFGTTLSPRFEHLTTDDGLPENSVRAILQDSEGFLWFGTHNGLARYDGYGMEVFLPTPGDSNSIFPRFLVALAEDDSSNIWIGSDANGLSCYNPNTHQFTNYRPDPTNPNALPGSRVLDISPSSDGIWLALGGAGLARFDGEVFHRIPILLPDGPQDLESYPNLSSLLITENRIWVGTENQGLAVRDRQGGPWRLFRNDPDDPRSLPSNWITDLYQDEGGRTWVATKTGLALYRGGNDFESFIPGDLSRPDQEINYLVQIDSDSSGDLWIGSAVGLYRFNPRTLEFTLFAHDPKVPDSPVLGPALSVLVDKSGIIWAGSWHTGLNKFDPWSLKFEVLLHNESVPGSLDDDAVVSLFEDSQGVLWVGTGSISSGGTYGGLNRRDPGSEAFQHLSPPEDPAGDVRRFNAIAEDSSGRLWLGSNKGIWRLDQQRQNIIRPPESPSDNNQLCCGSVMSLLVDRSDRLWASFWEGGLHRYDSHTDTWQSYWHDPRDSTSLTSNQLTALCLDDKGRIWVGTDQSGLHLYQEETDNFRRFPPTISGSGAITSLFPATDGRVWIGSSGGVLLVSEENWIEWTFTSNDGLPSDFLGRIQADSEGVLWVSTSRGLVRLNPQTGQFSVFDKRDGLPWNELHFASVMASDGRMMFGGHHGMISFRPDEVHSNPFIPPVVLVDIQVDDQSLSEIDDSPLTTSLQKTTDIELSHSRNNLALTFSSLHFSHPERNQYKFRLEPEDQDWRTAGTSRTAHYTNLDPGQYKFQVTGSNSDGVWNPEPTTLMITINPPWWQTRTAWFLYVLMASLFIYGVYRQIVARERINTKLHIKRLEASQLHEMDHLKSRFFANISHEFRTPLTLLKAGSQRLWEDSGFEDDELYSIMNRNADRLEQLIEQLLDLSRLESGHLPVRWQFGDWCTFLKDLVSAHKSLADSGEILLEAIWPDQIEHAWFDPDLLEKVTGNLLANALKFTPAGGQIEVVIRTGHTIQDAAVPSSSAQIENQKTHLPARFIGVEVRNTGSFIPPDQLNQVFDRFHQVDGQGGGDGRGTGIGLSLVKELVEWFGGSVDVSSTTEDGTIFRLQVPVFLEAPSGAFTVEQKLDDDLGTPPQESWSEEEVDEEQESGQATILVVEDHPDLRTIIRRELSNEFHLLEAPDGAVGLEIARKEIPDLVLTDLMMPLLDGFELCRRLKTDERTNHIPVVMLTAKTDSESRLAGLEIGADDYLTKPFDVSELKIRINNLLDQRRLLTERLSRWALDPKRRAEPVESTDEVFLLRAKEVMAANLEDSEFRVDDLCSALAMSRTQLHRKLRAIANQSTGEFMRTQRLLRAAELLSGHGGNVTEVAYSVGFKSLSHFAKAFREQFGVSPSEYG